MEEVGVGIEADAGREYLSGIRRPHVVRKQYGDERGLRLSHSGIHGTGELSSLVHDEAAACIGELVLEKMLKPGAVFRLDNDQQPPVGTALGGQRVQSFEQEVPVVVPEWHETRYQRTIPRSCVRQSIAC